MELSDHVTVLLSGLVAEQIRVREVTSGASNDLRRVATAVARAMESVCGAGAGRYRLV